MRVFCAVTADRLEQVCYMADTLKELAEQMGVPYYTLTYGSSTQKPVHGYKIIKVVIDDESED